MTETPVHLERLLALQNDQSKSWRQGQRALVESYVVRDSDLRSDPELLADFIYSEYCLREKYKETPSPAEYFKRFPQVADQLEKRFGPHGRTSAVELPPSHPPQTDGAHADGTQSAPPRVAEETMSGTPGSETASDATRLTGDETLIRSATGEQSVAEQLFDRYELIGELGRGGTAVVWKARDVELDRFVAIKLIHPGHVESEVGVKRFQVEARAAARLDHPGIVTVYDFGSRDGKYFLCMAFVEGRSLADHLAKGGAAAARGGSNRSGHRRCHRACPCAGNRPSRLEASEHPADCRRPATRNRLWAGSANRLAGGDHRQRRGSGDSELYVARTGCGENVACRAADRHLCDGCHPLLLRWPGDRRFRAQTSWRSSAAFPTEGSSPCARSIRPFPRRLRRFAPVAWPKNPNLRFKSAGELAAALSRLLRTPGTGSVAAAPHRSSAAKLFISFSRKDQTIAETSCDMLEAAGIPCWIAPRDIAAGRSWEKSSRRAIKESRVVLLILSSFSNKSERVLQEIELAARAGATIVTFCIEDVQPAMLAPFLRGPHRIDALAEPLDPHFSRLCTVVSALFPKKKGGAGRGSVRPAGETRDDNGLKLPLAWCPPGKFRMGSPPTELGRIGNEGPVDVTLTKGFWLGQHGVTQSEWQRVMQTTPWSGQNYVKEGEDYPATYVSWEDAIRFCEKLTEMERDAGRLPVRWKYRLPTEAQWEYACRAGAKSRFSFGDDESDLPGYAWFTKNTDGADEKIRASGGPKEDESVGAVRHARQRVGMVPGLVRGDLNRRHGPAGSAKGLGPGATGRRLGQHCRELPVGVAELVLAGEAGF